MLQFEAQCGTGCLKNFNEALNIIRRRHLDTVPLMARAVMKLGDLSPGVNFTIQYFLNRYPTLRSTKQYYATECVQAVHQPHLHPHADLALRGAERADQDGDGDGGHRGPGVRPHHRGQVSNGGP